MLFRYYGVFHTSVSFVKDGAVLQVGQVVMCRRPIPNRLNGSQYHASKGTLYVSLSGQCLQGYRFQGHRYVVGRRVQLQEWLYGHLPRYLVHYLRGVSLVGPIQASHTGSNYRYLLRSSVVRFFSFYH